jgi:hypothetical protein
LCIVKIKKKEPIKLKCISVCYSYSRDIYSFIIRNKYEGIDKKLEFFFEVPTYIFKGQAF